MTSVEARNREELMRRRNEGQRRGGDESVFTCITRKDSLAGLHWQMKWFRLTDVLGLHDFSLN